MLAKNTVHRITVTDLNNLGFGVGRVEGRVVFIAGAVDGDEVDARIIRVAANYAVARIERLVTPSPHRAPSPCPATGCGGCAYRGVSEEHERALKLAGIRAVFQKHGMSDIALAPMLSTGERYGYRNKAQYPVAAGKDGSLTIGFFAAKSHRVVAAEACPLQDARFVPILAELRRLLEGYRIPAYDEESGTGLLRHIYLRAGRVSGEILLTLVINGDSLPHGEEIADAVMATFPAVVGVYLNVNRERTNVICGDRYILLRGEGALTDTLCGVRLRISPASFYQVNHDAAELLYRRAREVAELKGDELLLDLFCGIGSIGLSMAGTVREIIGIEIVESAVLCARENAALNGIRNATFYCGDAGEAEGLLSRAERERGAPIHPDVVLLDPPRKGCDRDLLSYLLRLAPPRIVYISCNPDTLARDARILTDGGYRMGEITPVDLFPGTGHVESVVCLTRK